MDVARTEVDPVGQIQHADITRRTALRWGGSGLAALLLAGSARPRAFAAQDATPAAPTGAVGVSMQGMGTGQPVSAPGL